MSIYDVTEQISEQSENQTLRESARGFLLAEWPIEEAVTNCEKPDEIRTLFEKSAAQGWTSLGGDYQIPDSAKMLIALSEEVGRASAALSMADAYVANMVLHSIDLDDDADDTARVVLQGLRQGTCSVSVAWGVLDGDRNSGEVEVIGFEQKRLKGKLRFVENLMIADYLMVVTAGAQVALVPIAEEGVKTTLTPGLAVPALGDVEFIRSRATTFSVSRTLLMEASAVARLASTARALGAASRTLELAVEHAKTRVQFGQPIGKFQAVQHKLANSLTWVMATRGLIEDAVDCYQRRKPDWEARVDAARAFACVNLKQAAFDAQRMFGGLGFWEEHEAPRLFRRVHSELLRYGGVSAARNSFADYLLTDGYSSREFPAYDLGETAEAFRRELGAWLAANYPEERRRERWSTLPRHEQLTDGEFSKALGRDGYLGLTWPKQAGGRGLGVVEDFVFQEELIKGDLPYYGFGLAVNVLGPALMQYGTPEQIKKFLPKILRGECPVAIGYSEPDAGSDLASLCLAAVRDGDDWLITGTKVFQSFADTAEYHWLAARTDSDAPKHKGISIFLLPLNLSGITIQACQGLNDHTACSVFYDNVRVSGDCLVGKLNEGWKIITSALEHERVLLGTLIGRSVSYFKEFLIYLVNTERNGKPLARDPVVREKIGMIAAELMAGVSLGGNVVKTVLAGKAPIAEAAMTKCFSSETEKRLADGILDIIGTAGALNARASENVVDGKFEYLVRTALWSMLGGGTNEIQRNIIATAGLGLPRS